MGDRILKTHELKTWPVYFQPVAEGRKTFEYRKADRNYEVGDLLRLMEYDPVAENFTGEVVWRQISYVISDGFDLPAGTCILGIVKL